ncbi:MAG: chromosomal replication initiator protein DnaA [Ruminococcaceae bacterium]|nr:chromosomal replication initiator protein DnaA [Oscillospiraceae bacterium]
MNTLQDVFQQAKEGCRDHVPQATYDLFIAGMTPLSFDGAKITVEVRSEFIKDTVQRRYTLLLQDELTKVLGFDVDIAFTSPEEKEKDPNEITLTTPQPYELTFDSFIVGSTNRFAHAAAQAVAANPAQAYNPLFIWGDSGLGKTHLLKAIENDIKKSRPTYNILYIEGEKFTNEIITAINNNTTNDFRNKYRAVDVLLVDDIQFIGGKDSTQEEFFHTFNTLYTSGRQIVLASDRPPKEIKRLEDRLRTRFESGLIADIQAPDYETRVAILRRKAYSVNFDLPDEVAEYIANHLKNNIRQLEGTIKKMSASLALEGINPSIGTAQNAIKDILNETQPIPVTIEKILLEVSRTYGASPEALRGPSRQANISNARKISMYIIKEITALSMDDIGHEFGGRDHSTVVYAVKDIYTKMKKDPSFRDTVNDIMKNVKSQ